MLYGRLPAPASSTAGPEPMRVLVTRPEPQARRTAGRLEQLGHKAVLLPLTKAIHDPQAAHAALGKPHVALAVTSSEALRVLSSLGPELRPNLDKPLFAVGPATAAAARRRGFDNVLEGPGNGSGLAAHIVAQASPPAGTILYLAGRPRSPEFETSLADAGLDFSTAEIYAMQPISHQERAVAAAFKGVDAVLLYSRENARLLFDLPSPAPDVVYLCISEKVAEAIPRQFHGNIKIAVHPDEQALLALL